MFKMYSGTYDSERLVGCNLPRRRLFSKILDRFNLRLSGKVSTGNGDLEEVSSPESLEEGTDRRKDNVSVCLSPERD